MFETSFITIVYFYVLIPVMFYVALYCLHLVLTVTNLSVRWEPAPESLHCPGCGMGETPVSQEVCAV